MKHNSAAGMLGMLDKQLGVVSCDARPSLIHSKRTSALVDVDPPWAKHRRLLAPVLAIESAIGTGGAAPDAPLGDAVEPAVGDSGAALDAPRGDAVEPADGANGAASDAPEGGDLVDGVESGDDAGPVSVESDDYAACPVFGPDRLLFTPTGSDCDDEDAREHGACSSDFLPPSGGRDEDALTFSASETPPCYTPPTTPRASPPRASPPPSPRASPPPNPAPRASPPPSPPVRRPCSPFAAEGLAIAAAGLAAAITGSPAAEGPPEVGAAVALSMIGVSSSSARQSWSS